MFYLGARRTLYSWQTALQDSDAFSPELLFLLGEQGAWYDPSDLSTLFQDSAGTTPVTAVEQPVGRMLDKSGRGNHVIQATTTNRPILKQDANGEYYLLFDGVDDGMATAAINFAATDKITVFAGVRRLSDASLGNIVELGDTSRQGVFFVFAPLAGVSPEFAFGLRGDSALPPYARAIGTPAPVSAVLTCSFDISQPTKETEIIPRINGVTPSLTWVNTIAGAGTFGAYPLYIGRRLGLYQPFNGHFYGLIIRGALSTESQIISTESWLAAKTGIVL